MGVKGTSYPGPFQVHILVGVQGSRTVSFSNKAEGCWVIPSFTGQSGARRPGEWYHSIIGQRGSASRTVPCVTGQRGSGWYHFITGQKGAGWLGCLCSPLGTCCRSERWKKGLRCRWRYNGGLPVWPGCSRRSWVGLLADTEACTENFSPGVFLSGRAIRYGSG